MDKVHKIYMKYLGQWQVSEVISEKSFYFLKVLFYESIKLLILFFIFWLMGEEKIFLVSLISVVMIRTNLGGIHLPTQKACLAVSVLIFSLIAILGKFCVISGFYGGVIAVVSCLVIVAFAPIPSKQRPCYSQFQKRKFKVRGIIMVFCLYACGFLFSQFRNYILWAITLQVTEAVMVIAMKERRWVRWKKRLYRKSARN